MVGKQQLQRDLAGLADGGGVGLDHHAVRNGHYTSGGKSAGSSIHQAHTAGANLVDVLQVAQGGNLDIGRTGGFKHRSAGRNLHLDAIYRQRYHIHAHSLLFYLREIALKRHFSIHAPHLMHLEESMTKGFLTSPEIAPTGQTLEQREHPLQTAGSIV